MRDSRDRDAVMLTIVDDGIGMAQQQEGGQEAWQGLAGIRERIKMAGGELVLASGPGLGVSIRAEFPLQGSA